MSDKKNQPLVKRPPNGGAYALHRGKLQKTSSVPSDSTGVDANKTTDTDGSNDE